jgi:hypothetical protein
MYRTLAVVAAVAGLIACETASEKTFNPKPLRDLCAKWGGVPLHFPDSRYVPGAVFQLQEKKAPAFLDSGDFLKTCGVPPEYFDVNKSEPVAAGISGAVEVGAGALLQYQGVKGGANFKSVKKATLNVQNARAWGLPTPRINVWLEDNPAGLKASCKSQLASPAYYVVGDTLRIEQSEYVLHDEKGGDIQLTAPELEQIVDAQVNAKASVTTDGKLSIGQPVTICVRQAVWRDKGFAVLGDGEPSIADRPGDRALLEYYDQETGLEEETPAP